MATAPETTAPAVTAENLFTAACLWEAALEALNATRPDIGAFAEALQAYQRKHGTAQLRDDVARLAPACDAAWSALPPDRRDDLCFDWDFCPAWLEGNFFTPKRRYRGDA